MVLELLINPAKAERSPWELFFIGLVYSSVAMLLSLYIFSDHIGLVMVFLTTLACVYMVQQLLKLEEDEDEKPVISELAILKHHGKALSVFMFLFLGFTAAFSFWYIVLPSDVTHNIFSLQENTIRCINSNVQGCATETEGAFTRILLNNFKVATFTLIFAFFYGAGAIFILAWNAAIVGVAIGILFRNTVSTIIGGFGLTSVASYFGIYSASVMRFMTHGVFEILAYFMVALAGGIISIAIAKHDFSDPQFRKILIDAVDLTALGFGTLLFAAIIEVYITPLLF